MIEPNTAVALPSPQQSRPKKRINRSRRQWQTLLDEFYRSGLTKVAFCQQRQRPELLPSSPFSKAIAYMQNREHALRVFLEDPAVPMDNNHTERALRVVPMGRKNWMFCWTELGAEHVGIIQSLIVTCKLQGIDPATYLVDVLQRVAIHPASKVEELTPRVWKDRFADNPLRSDLTHEH